MIVEKRDSDPTDLAEIFLTVIQKALQKMQTDSRMAAKLLSTVNDFKDELNFQFGRYSALRVV